MKIDIEFLITLVEARPVLWDKTCEEYKNKNETRKAWREICILIKNHFEEMEDDEQNTYRKELIKRWGNIRDSFKKSCKKLKLNTKSGVGVSNIKKYTFHDQLQFLNKIFKEPPKSDDSTQEMEYSQGSEENESDNEIKKEECDQLKKPSKLLRSMTPEMEDSQPTEEDESDNEIKEDYDELRKSTKQMTSRKRKYVDQHELNMLKPLEEQPDRHLSFFRGIIPTLIKFNDDEVVEFQLGVMELITKIKKQKYIAQYQRMYQPFTV